MIDINELSNAELVRELEDRLLSGRMQPAELYAAAGYLVRVAATGSTTPPIEAAEAASPATPD